VATSLFMRALIAFLLLPGIVAFVMPVVWLLYSRHIVVEHDIGIAFLVIGFIGLIWSIRDFYVSGKGTLAPWSPPQKLVIVGLYHYSRNPMYIAVLLILLGWCISFGSLVLLSYTCFVAISFHLRVVYGEEPWLSRYYGIQWSEYISHVPRWIW